MTIGLVPCAVGGTQLKRWQPGGDLYSNAVYRARLAMQDGTLKGILWHQGESDSGTATNANTYGDRLAGMIRDIRADLGAPGLPVVVGQIGEFLYDRGPDHSPYARVVNAALAALPDKVPATACAPSQGPEPQRRPAPFRRRRPARVRPPLRRRHAAPAGCPPACEGGTISFQFPTLCASLEPHPASCSADCIRDIGRRRAACLSGRPAAAPGTHLLPNRGALERHRQPALRRGHCLRRGPWPAAAHPDLAGSRLPHPRHDGRLVGQLPGLPLRPVRRREPRGRGPDGPGGEQDQPRRRRLLHVPGDELRQVPLPGRPARARRRGRGDPPGGAGVLGARRLFGRLQARVARLLPRGLAAAAQLGGCPVARLQAQVLPLPARPAAGVRLRAGLQPPHGPAGALLRAHPQPAQLRPLAHRQPGIEPGPAERLRRLHRPGVDRHRAHPQPLSRPTARAHLRDRLPGIRRDDEPRPRRPAARSGS